MSGRAKKSVASNQVSIPVGANKSCVVSSHVAFGDLFGYSIFVVRTNNAAVTDSSHRSNKNSSRAIDSLSTLMMRWHSCGRKNSMSS